MPGAIALRTPAISAVRISTADQKRSTYCSHRMSATDAAICGFAPAGAGSAGARPGRCWRAAAPSEARRPAATPTTRRRWPERRRRWPRCTGRRTSCSPAAWSLRGADRGAARLPGRGQHLGLVVRALPLRVPVLPAGSAKTASGSPSSASTARTPTTPPSTFLEELPLPYPSYIDPDQEIADELGAARPSRHRLLRPRGRARLHQTGRSTTTRPSCGADIERYALGRSCEQRIIGTWTSSSSSPLVADRRCWSPSCCCRPAACSPSSAPLGLVAAGVVALDGRLRAPADYVGPALITLGVLSIVTFFFVTRKVLAAHRDEPVRTGCEELIGAEAEVAHPLDPEGQVWIEGALWRARLADGGGPVASGIESWSSRSTA